MSNHETNLERQLLTERNRLWDEAEALRHDVKRLRQAISAFVTAATSRASGTWSQSDVRALEALRATLVTGEEGRP